MTNVCGSESAEVKAARQQICLAALETAAPAAAWEAEVTIVVTTFERPACIARFVQSARATFGALPVLVCDASEQPLFPDGTRLGEGIRWLALPKALGHAVGAARNYALSHVQTPCFFLCDDDHVLGRHTRLQSMIEALEAHDLDVVGGCQGRNDYGTAIFVLHGRYLEQRFYHHHGRIVPGLVRCDRVSNTFVARTAVVRSVGWEPRVFGDEHAEFFWRAKMAGLRVAQMAHTYVRHERAAETPSHLWSRLLRAFVDHPDREYLRRRQGGSAAVARAAYAKHCLEKNHLTGIVSRAHWRDKQALTRLMDADQKRPPDTLPVQDSGACAWAVASAGAAARASSDVRL